MSFIDVLFFVGTSNTKNYRPGHQCFFFLQVSIYFFLYFKQCSLVEAKLEDTLVLNMDSSGNVIGKIYITCAHVYCEPLLFKLNCLTLVHKGWGYSRSYYRNPGGFRHRLCECSTA